MTGSQRALNAMMRGLLASPLHFALSRRLLVIDVTGSEPVEHRGFVPPRAIVVPGTRPKEFPAGTYQLACALIVGWRSEATDLKVSLNDALRELD